MIYGYRIFYMVELYMEEKDLFMNQLKKKNKTEKKASENDDGFYDICDDSVTENEKKHVTQTEEEKKFKKFIRHISQAS